MHNTIFYILFVYLLFTACTPESIELDIEDQFGSLPALPLSPSDNPMSQAKVELGRNLFWDPILSGNKDVACVTCHHPKNGYAEQLDLSVGVGGRGLSTNRRAGVLVKRNSMTILNAAYNGLTGEMSYAPEQAAMFWDNRVKSLEAQAIQPILSVEEMRGNAYREADAMDTIIARLTNIEAYQQLFTAAFGDLSITTENIGKAIAAFERTLIANNSPFDRYARGDESALTDLEVNGMLSFVEMGCANCHGGPMFSDFELHVLTVPENSNLQEIDRGEGNFAFRTPTLRNLAYTAPYMHNGVFETLEEVLEFYGEAGNESQNPHVTFEEIDEEMNGLFVNQARVEAIVAFMNSLNDDDFDRTELKTVPSQLSPGGRIHE